ncbi:hypothetical protein MBLNU457_6986t1 [Dothideomycetes sp. NU457]
MISINHYYRREIAKASLTTNHPPDWATKRPKAQAENERIEIARLTGSEVAEPGEITEGPEKPTRKLPSFSQLDTSAQPPEIAQVVAKLARLEAYEHFAAQEKARLVHLIETGQPLVPAAPVTSTPAVSTPDPRVQFSTGPRRTNDGDSVGPVGMKRFVGTGPQQTGANIMPVAPRRLSGRVTTNGSEDARMSGTEDDSAGRRQSVGSAVDPRRDPGRFSSRVTTNGSEDVRMSGSEDDSAERRQSTGTAIDPRRDPRRR